MIVTNTDIICNFFFPPRGQLREIIREKNPRQHPNFGPTGNIRHTTPPRTTTTKTTNDCANGPFLTLEKKKSMRNNSALLRSVRALRTSPPRRLASSSSPSPTSSSSSSTDAAALAQKKAQDAFSAASSAALRAGTFARNALGPFGTRLSGLLGSTSCCPSLFSSVRSENVSPQRTSNQSGITYQ